MNETLPQRNEVPKELTWDLSLLFENQTAYKEAVAAFKKSVAAFEYNYKGKLQEQIEFTDAFNDYNQLMATSSALISYGTLGYEVDKINSTIEENLSIAYQLIDYINSHLSFFTVELTALPEEILKIAVNNEKSYQYVPFVNSLLRKKPFLLSNEAEQVLAELSQSLNGQTQIYTALKYQDMRFSPFTVDGKEYQNTFAEFEQNYEGHSNLEVRHASWKSFHQGLANYQNTAARNYIEKVETEKKISQIRGFDSVFEYLLHGQEVDVTIYNRIIDTYMNKFAPVMRRYAKLLQKYHDMDRISLADIKMPFSKQEPSHITEKDAEEMLLKALAPLGESYLAVIKQAFKERWIDFPMNQTKSTGGFCSTVYQGPAYILLNWTATLSETLVLAHELGHAVHFNETYANQPALTPEVSLFFVEAPSTANEVITCMYLLNSGLLKKQDQISLISEFISRTYFHNMVTHLLEADFQRKVYQGVDRGVRLNAESLNQFFEESLKTFWGDALEINSGAELTWMRQPHYFMGLYSYTYSAGLTIGTQVGQKIASGDEHSIQKWLEVLKTGGAKTPLELALMAGVDMTRNDPFEDTIHFVDRLVDQLELLVEKGTNV